MADTNIPEELAKAAALFSGGVMNPLAKEQVRIQPPSLPQISTPPSPESPGSQIPKLTGNYQGTLDNPKSYAMALKNHMENPEAYAQDKYKYGKDYAYDADYTGLNFQRYYNAPRVYKEVGFSPWRDNEKIYNNKMTWWDSFKRSAGQSSHLMNTGFTSMLPWNAWNGDDTDEAAAKDMERAHAIGADNKGGVGSFANNLMLDAGYTLGIGAEFAAEELVLWGASTIAAPFTGGTSWGAAAVETGLQASKLSRLLKPLGTAGKVLSKTSEGLSALKDINKARDVFNYVKSGKPVGQLMDIITPGTFKYLQETNKLIKGTKGGENIYTLALAAKGVGAFYRDAREIAAVLSESKLEGGSVELEMRNQLTDSFFRDNGRMPNADEYQQIDQHAADAGRETYLWNLPALWISNKIVFDKALKGIKPLQSFRKELSEGLAGKLAFNDAAAKAGKEAWSVVATGMKADVASLFTKSTWAPKNLLRNTIGNFANYTKANITEALQEQYQDAVSASMKEYYTDRFNHPGRSGMHESWGDIFAENVGKQFTTAQGFETFASGFLMGSLVQVPQHIVYDKLPQKFYQITDPKGFADYKAQKEERTNRVVAALNAATVDPKRFFNPNITNAVSQGILNDHAMNAAVDGDTKQYLDVNDEAMFEHLHTLLQTDKLSLVTDYIKDMKSMTAEELEQAFGKVDPSDGDAKTFYNRKIDSMLQRADYIDRRNKFIEDRYGNPFNPHKFSPGKDSEKYLQESNNWQGWEAAKKIAVFSDYAFDRSINRMKSILDDMNTNSPVSNSSAHEFTLLLDPKAMVEDATLLRGEISSMKGIPGTRRESAKKEKKLEALQDFMGSLTKYRQVLTEHAKSGGNLSDIQKADLKDSLEDLHDKLGTYTKVIANLNDGYVFNNRIDQAFTKIKDFYHLKNDSTNLASVINKLENPETFTSYASRAANIHKQLHEDRLNLYKQSYTGKLDADEFNQLLNQIMELGAYMHPNDTKSFRDKNIVPTEFYDILTGNNVPKDSIKYKQIMDLVGKYYEANKPAGVEDQYISDEEYKNYVDNNIVSPERLESIAYSIINKENLSEREKAIFSGKTAEINEIIRLASPVKEDTVTEGKVKFTSKTPIDVLEAQAPELLTALLEEYKTQNRKAFERKEEMWDPDSLTKSDEEIKRSTAFNNFISSPGKPAAIISKYNKDNGRTLEPESPTSQVAKTKPDVLILTASMRQQLVDLGYMNTNMPYAEAKRILDNKIAFGSEEEAKIKAAQDLENTRKNNRQAIVANLEDKLNQIQSIETLEDFEKAIGKMMLESNQLQEAGLNSDIINEMINQKKAELRVTFDDIVEGEAVRVKKYGIMVVKEKTGNSIKLTKFGEPEGFILTINKEDVSSQIDFRAGMENVASEVSDIDLEAIKETEATREAVLGDETTRKDLEATSKNVSEDDLMDDLGEDNCTTGPVK